MDWRADGKPYMPSNGTEGECFQSRWCYRCANDNPDAGDLCEILGNALFGEQSVEWIYRNREPTCTAFIPFEAGGKPKPEPRCPHTLELF